MKVTFTSLLPPQRQFVSGLEKLTSKGRLTDQFFYGKHFLCVGVFHKNVSQILVTIYFSSGEIARKTLSAKKSFTGNINLGEQV